MMGAHANGTAPVKTRIPLLLSLSLVTDLRAQRISDAVVGYADTPAAMQVSPAPAATSVGLRREPSTTAMIATGTLFAAGGIMAGAVIGESLEHCGPGEEFCGLAGAVLGGIAGEVLMLPIGIHVISDQSTLGAKMRASWATFLAGTMLGGVTGGASVLLIPPAQLFATIFVEKRAIRRAERTGT